jgi:hypothetical protein
VREDEVHHNILKEYSKIFQSMFSAKEHLDIVSINEQQELVVRELCCPFFTSSEFQIEFCDFILTSSEGFELDKNPTNCYKRERLYGKHPDDYMLCDILPPILEGSFSLHSEGINQVIFASRHKGFSLFPISNWPAYVHVARSKVHNIEYKTYIEESDIELIARGELYKSRQDIK